MAKLEYIANNRIEGISKEPLALGDKIVLDESVAKPLVECGALKPVEQPKEEKPKDEKK